MCAKKIITDRKMALEKGARYCAYQERSQQEVRDKLYEAGVAGSLVEEIISELIQQDFINEERFARAWAGGKFRIKGWGRIKIRKGLQFKRVSEYCIRAGLAEIDEAAYYQKLTGLLEEKLKSLSAKPGTPGTPVSPDTPGTAGTSPFINKRKAATYAISRGYEPELVWEVIREYSEREH